MRINSGRMATAVVTTVAVAVAVGLLGACGGRAPSPPPPEPSPMDREVYKIGVTDVLAINVWRNPELSVEVPVRADGMISVPLIDDVQAEGLTPQELKEVVAENLSEFITAPDVTVLVRQMNSRFVSVIGEVRQPTRVPLTRDLRVLEAIALVGGFTTFADRNDVRIVRLRRTHGDASLDVHSAMPDRQHVVDFRTEHVVAAVDVADG